ncbi:Pectinesterase inhibitor domain [Dillenia turbinata]|uniref:Pectinesterase n=1 Tax=Dillenia turbinata TaxID=194707 RepID=A0AAN8YSZ0_9MAGN
MDTVKSFKGYGKVDPVEDQAFRKKSRKRLIILIVSVVVLLAIVLGVVVGTLANKKNSSDDTTPSSSSGTPAQSLKTVCSVTQYPDSCISSISAAESSNATTDPEEIFKLSLHVATGAISKLSTLSDQIIAQLKITNETVKSALTECNTLFQDAIDQLNDTISSAEAGSLSESKIEDIQTWLSSVITYQDTCLEGLRDLNQTTLEEAMQSYMQNATQYSSNSLAIVTKVISFIGKFNIPIHRKLLGVGAPGWMGAADRRLLQDTNPTADAIVAQDGSGQYKTINEALKAVPQKKNTRFVIYVKAGKYVEKVTVGKNLWNVMMYGDGMAKTIISGSLNFIDGTPTVATATVTIQGRGFFAKDIGFENSAGAAKHQAVALRVTSDRSVFYRCAFIGFQDTLYTHSNRQFYRECQIVGTIDFIFGNAAVVLQGCNIQARQPLANQFDTLTAQGKSDPNMNTGMSIHKSTLSTYDTVTAPVYLGRPWRNYSTTVIMESTIGSFLSPAGWIAWITNVLPPDTIFYAEYQNTGPGADVSKRVNWTGVHTSITSAQASKYTVSSLIQGDTWLPATRVTFDSTL